MFLNTKFKNNREKSNLIINKNRKEEISNLITNENNSAKYDPGKI